MCHRKNHTSICDKSRNMMLATENLVIQPVVVLKGNSVTYCVLLDTVARSSYAINQNEGKTNPEINHEH